MKKIRKPSSENEKIAESRPTILRDPKIAESRPTTLPLPGGEGRGEGNRLGNIAGSRFQYASKNENALHESEGRARLSTARRAADAKGSGALGIDAPDPEDPVIQVHRGNAHQKERGGSS